MFPGRMNEEKIKNSARTLESVECIPESYGNTVRNKSYLVDETYLGRPFETEDHRRARKLIIQAQRNVCRHEEPFPRPQGLVPVPELGPQ